MSSEINPEFVERYQLLYEKDPKSKVFAPLAEAYRRMKLLKEAEDLCVKGLAIHPNFPSGRVVYAKLLIDLNRKKEAYDHLKQACELSPENILAQRLLAQTALELRLPKEALSAFKMVLFLNPNDQAAQKNIAKLESLTADEYDDELFEMKPLRQAVSIYEIEAPTQPSEPKVGLHSLTRTLERALSLADAYMVRADFEKAYSVLEQAENEVGQNPEITKRLNFLISRNRDYNLKIEEPQAIAPLKQDIQDKKDHRLNKLKSLLQRVNDRRVQ